jgi:hypothetical protein
MGRGLLFQHQLPWRGRFSRQAPKHSPTYAVLAILSDSYPPLKGRLPTCYSPVRHFTRGRSPFLVRLACVRPAANVRSEPGSNSPVNLKSRTSARYTIQLKQLPRDPNSVFSSRFSFQRPTRRDPRRPKRPTTSDHLALRSGGLFTSHVSVCQTLFSSGVSFAFRRRV